MMDEQMLLLKKVEAASNILRSYSCSEYAQTLVKLLDALIEGYKIDLIHVHVDSLVRLQASIQQTQAIRNMVSGESRDSPKI